ncbi:delta-60 repeat domain-containing protein [Pseudomonas syringae group genomosp. 7]|uniref:delta-60 repeat domain-containing protein n=1 Tax=Pseudomonas syringae group genomosp. 7 TaxID=251699 RepID=UPI00376F8389
MDAWFGADGVVYFYVSLGLDYLSGMSVQADGKVIYAGESLGGCDLKLVRVNADGSCENAY